MGWAGGGAVINYNFCVAKISDWDKRKTLRYVVWQGGGAWGSGFFALFYYLINLLKTE